MDFWISPEKERFVIVALAGALGGVGYTLRSFSRYVGERKVVYSWLASYYLAPLIGAVAGTIVYLVLRAGLISGGGVNTVDPFGFAAVSALVGLFSAQALEKLKLVFEVLFTKVGAGREPIEETGGTTISEIVPTTAKAGDTVEVRGTNLHLVKSVSVGEVDAHFEFDGGARVLRVTLPRTATAGRIVLTSEESVTGDIQLTSAANTSQGSSTTP